MPYTSEVSQPPVSVSSPEVRPSPNKKGSLAARVAVLALFVLTLFLMFRVFQPFLPGIAWAAFLVTAFYPMHDAIRRMLRGRSGWTAATLSTLIVTLLIVLPISVVLFKVATSVGHVSTYVQEHMDMWQALFDHEGRLWVQFEALRTRLSAYVDVSQWDVRAWVETSLQNLAKRVAEGTAPLAQNIFSGLLSLLVTIATMVVFFKEGLPVMSASLQALPLQESDKEAVVKRLLEVSRAIFYGIMMTAAVQALLGTIAWTLVGLPQPLVFGIMMFFSAFIPVFGTALVWGPGAAYLFFQGYVGKAIFLAAFGLGVVSSIDNFIKPLFISGKGRLHILLVFFGVFGGLSAFGLPGLFLGPLVITFFLVLVEIVRRDLF